MPGPHGELPERLPWNLVETLPSADQQAIDTWDAALASARRRGDDVATARAAVGAALNRYWAHQLLDTGATWAELAAERAALVGEATTIARRQGDPDLLAEALLGRLHACWGVDREPREVAASELFGLQRAVTREDLHLRIDEWRVLACLDRGEVDAATTLVDEFDHRYARGQEAELAERRVALWRSNLAMLTGRLDEAIALNESAVSDTAGLAGSPSAFQNVAVVRSIERYLRGGLADVVEAVRSIRASAVRVETNWDMAYAFVLGETGALEECRQVFEPLAADDFAVIRPDLNWLATMHLVGHTAVRLEDRARAEVALSVLEPHGAHDATHGMGYASYGPTARVLGRLCALLGRERSAAEWFGLALDERPNGPWTALARLDRGSLRGCPASQRSADLLSARDDLRRWSMGHWEASARDRRMDLHLEGSLGPSAVRRGDVWTLVHPSGSARIPAHPTVSLLVRLLRTPGQEWSPAAVEGTNADVLPVLAPVERPVDSSAWTAYRARLRHLDARRREGGLDEAEEREVEMLRSELAAARYAPSTSTELERARMRVTTSLRRVLDRIGAQSPPLGSHLRRSITTGRLCSYSPEDGATWTILATNDPSS